MVLIKMKIAESFIGEPVTDAVITDTYFNDSQRNSTKMLV